MDELSLAQTAVAAQEESRIALEVSALEYQVSSGPVLNVAAIPCQPADKLHMDAAKSSLLAMVETVRAMSSIPTEISDDAYKQSLALIGRSRTPCRTATQVSLRLPFCRSLCRILRSQASRRFSLPIILACGSRPESLGGAPGLILITPMYDSLCLIVCGHC